MDTKGGVLACVLLGSMAGCGAADESAALGPITVDGCSLLTGEEVAELLGAEVEGEQDDFSGFDVACTWSTQDGDGRLLDVTVEAARLSPANIEQEYATFKENMAFREDVQGVGDAAFLADGIGGSIIVTRENGVILFIGTDLPDKDAMLASIASEVLDRID